MCTSCLIIANKFIRISLVIYAFITPRRYDTLTYIYYIRLRMLTFRSGSVSEDELVLQQL